MITLRELAPGILSALGVASGGVALPPARQVCLLLIDGLGDLLLSEHAARAPTLKPDLAVVRTRAEPQAAALVSMHGGVTDAEAYVPLLLHAG